MPAGQTVPAESHPVRKVLTDLAVMTVIGLVLALVGPFNSFNAPFAWRLVYWLSLSWAGYACYRPIGGLVARLGPRYDLPDAALWVAACLVATVPMSVVVWLVSQPDPWRLPGLEAALTMYGYVLAIGGPVTLLFHALDRPAKTGPVAAPAPVQTPPQADAAEPAPAPRLFERLSPGLGQDLVALEMEDHYLRVHTALGSELILLRMRDAVGEVAGIDGAQVHRSWWVARGAVQGVEREGRNLRLRLPRGLCVPVARNMAPALKAAGWL